MNHKSRKKTCIKKYNLLLFIGAHQEGEFITQTHLARELRMPLTTLNYQVTKLKQEGLIDKHLKLTEKGFRAFKFLWENADKKKLRGHNIQAIFEVLKCPDKFPDCFSKSIYQPITNRKYRGLKTELNGFTFMFYSPKKIVCVIPDIFADTDEELSSAVQLLIPKLRDLLEYEFNGVRIGGHSLAKIQTMHIAVLDSIIAKTYLLKGFTKENKGYAIDNSHGIPEIELTNPDTALRDIIDLLNLDNMFKRGLISKNEEKDNNDNRKTNPGK